MQITGKYDMNPHKAHLNYNESWKEKKICAPGISRTPILNTGTLGVACTVL
jgi:hypothetical protein